MYSAIEKISGITYALKAPAGGAKRTECKWQWTAYSQTHFAPSVTGTTSPRNICYQHYSENCFEKMLFKLPESSAVYIRPLVIPFKAAAWSKNLIPTLRFNSQSFHHRQATTKRFESRGGIRGAIFEKLHASNVHRKFRNWTCICISTFLRLSS